MQRTGTFKQPLADCSSDIPSPTHICFAGRRDPVGLHVGNMQRRRVQKEFAPNAHGWSTGHTHIECLLAGLHIGKSCWARHHQCDSWFSPFWPFLRSFLPYPSSPDSPTRLIPLLSTPPSPVFRPRARPGHSIQKIITKADPMSYSPMAE